MKISSYAVQTQSQRSYLKTEQQAISAGGAGLRDFGMLEVRRDAVVLQFSDASRTQVVISRLGDALPQDATPQTGPQEEERPQQTGQQALAAGEAGEVQMAQSAQPQSPAELKVRMLDSLLYALTGRRLNPQLAKLLSFKECRGYIAVRSAFSLNTGTARSNSENGRGQLSVMQTQYERESVAYRADGLIKTADGRSISVNMSLSMSREVYRHTAASLKLPEVKNTLIDPLIINYGGTAASLSGEKFDFDLDSDGAPDKISFAGAGSGFLALDKNGDGAIGNGGELFGPNTGNGFGELRSYDTDGNCWIDENDAVFKNLRIWSKDADGNDQLFTLLEKDVGAIYLGESPTRFTLTDMGGDTQGVMRSTSFFLRESGGAGAISHIDLSV